MGSMVQSIVGCCLELRLLQFSVAQVLVTTKVSSDVKLEADPRGLCKGPHGWLG